MRVDIRTLKENEDNPRIITEENLDKLVDSLLIFPRMLDLRRIVVAKDSHLLLGGNMRHRAMSRILMMERDEMLRRITEQGSRRKKTDGEVDALVQYWDGWRLNPMIDIEEADLSEDEQKEFIIKDNVSAGTWNYDMLQNFDKDDLKEWGLTDWMPVQFGVTVDSEDFSPNADERQRIIITFPRELRQKVHDILGIEGEGKTSYRLEELIDN